MGPYCWRSYKVWWSEDEVRALRISVANNLNSLRNETLEKLANSGIGADIGNDGAVTLIPLNDKVRGLNAKVEDLIAKRAAARKAKNFAESDRIRDELAAMGIRLKDNPDGTTTPEIAR